MTLHLVSFVASLCLEMFGPITLASAAATWVVNKLLDRLSSAAINALLSSEGLEELVNDLVDALRRANLVLGAVPAGAAAGIKIGNEELVVQINDMRQLASDLAKHLDELEYQEIKEKVHHLPYTAPKWPTTLSFFFKIMERGFSLYIV